MTTDRPRRILMLQGPPTGFWADLARAFEAQGHAILRVNFSTADWLFWRRPGAVNYRGRFSRWRGFVGALMEREGIDAVIYYADRLPYHVVAAEEAGARGIPAHAIEFGYLRPHWLTLERGGMGAFSHFPADPDAIRALARDLPAAPAAEARFPHDFLQEAVADMSRGLANSLLAFPFPFYRMDRPRHPLLEYPAWIPRLIRRRREDRRAEAITRAAEDGRWPYHLVALQLETDYQIRDNAPCASLAEVIAELIASFARHARADRRLIFKLHPLDNGLEGWPHLIDRLARRHGVRSRVHCIDGGRLDALIRHADGAAMVNSTVGLQAVMAGVPTLALGAAIYDMAGLTHQGPPSRFWEAPEPVDRALARDLIRVLAATIQVRGSFYHPEGRRLAAAEVARRVAADEVNEPGAYVAVPPRLPLRRRAG